MPFGVVCGMVEEEPMETGSVRTCVVDGHEFGPTIGDDEWTAIMEAYANLQEICVHYDDAEPTYPTATNPPTS